MSDRQASILRPSTLPTPIHDLSKTNRGLLFASCLIAWTAATLGCHNASERIDAQQPPHHDESGDAGEDAPEVATPLPDGDPYNEWVQVVWAGRDCLWQTASRDLELGKLRWLSCDGSIDGCRYLDVSDVEGGRVYSNDKIFGFYPSVLENGTLRLTLAANFHEFRFHGVFDDDELLVAWKAYDTCGTHTPQSHRDGRISLIVNQVDEKGYVLGSRIAFGDAKTLLKPSPPFVDVTAEDMWGRKVANNIAMVYQAFLGHELAAFYLAPPPRIVAWDYQNRPAQVEIAEEVLEASNPIIVGKELIFEQYGAPDVRGFAVRRADGHVEMLYVKPGVWPAELMGDGTNLVWQESIAHGDGTFSAELWTAPLSTERPWQARKVATLGSREFYQGAFGEGFFAYRIDSDELGLVRLSDGAQFMVSSPPDLGWSRISGIAAGEVWALLHRTPGNAGFRYTIGRIPIDSITQ